MVPSTSRPGMASLPYWLVYPYRRIVNLCGDRKGWFATILSMTNDNHFFISKLVELTENFLAGYCSSLFNTSSKLLKSERVSPSVSSGL